jgi:hypothetical protein
MVRFHRGEESFKVNTAVPPSQQWIVNDKASVRFGRIPTGMESPLYIEHDGRGSEEMLPNVEIL